MRSTEEITESLKQVVKAPQTISQLKDQLEMFIALNKIFFGEKGKSAKALTRFLKSIKSNESELLHISRDNFKMPVMMACAMDRNFQRWLKQNEIAQDREEVSDTLLEFERITEDVLSGRFTMVLPKCFSFKDSSAPPDESLATGNLTGKRKRGDDDRELSSAVVTNERPVQGFEATKEEKEKFNEFFGGSNVCHRVSWRANSRMCPRWFSKLYCFENCNNRESHVEASKVPAKKKKEYVDYLKKIRRR